MIAKQDGREIPKHIAVIMDGNGRWVKTGRYAYFWSSERGPGSS